MIKSFLNLCLILFLDMLAYLVAIIAAIVVAWAALRGAQWMLACFRNGVMVLKTRLKNLREA